MEATTTSTYFSEPESQPLKRWQEPKEFSIILPSYILESFQSMPKPYLC